MEPCTTVLSRCPHTRPCTRMCGFVQEQAPTRRATLGTQWQRRWARDRVYPTGTGPVQNVRIDTFPGLTTICWCAALGAGRICQGNGHVTNQSTSFEEHLFATEIEHISAGGGGRLSTRESAVEEVPLSLASHARRALSGDDVGGPGASVRVLGPVNLLENGVVAHLMCPVLDDDNLWNTQRRDFVNVLSISNVSQVSCSSCSRKVAVWRDRACQVRRCRNVVCSN